MRSSASGGFPEEQDSLASFVEDVVGPDSIRVEEDFGQGFVRLRSSEAERRQAAQDIRSSEDAVIELLRNSRDAGASNVLIATGKSGNLRNITVIDDGSGIPEEMTDLVFQPRVTSKLDSAHIDKWGFHGRGMALFSIAENSVSHEVVYSCVGEGTSMQLLFSVEQVLEKTDQSTFPHFEEVDGVLSMRGPKNILRVASEFAFENRKALNVYCGSATEVAATLFSIGIKGFPAKERIFGAISESSGPALLLASSTDPEDFSRRASMLGLDISSRSARRIVDGEILPLASLGQRLEEEAAKTRGSSREADASNKDSKTVNHDSLEDAIKVQEAKKPRVKVSRADLRELELKMSRAFEPIAEKYYLDRSESRAYMKDSKIVVEIDLSEES